jgi:hypothetical protein
LENDPILPELLLSQMAGRDFLAGQRENILRWSCFAMAVAAVWFFLLCAGGWRVVGEKVPAEFWPITATILGGAALACALNMVAGFYFRATISTVTIGSALLCFLALALVAIGGFCFRVLALWLTGQVLGLFWLPFGLLLELLVAFLRLSAAERAWQNADEALLDHLREQLAAQNSTIKRGRSPETS